MKARLFENLNSTLYNLDDSMSSAANPSPQPRTRNWSLVAAGLLLLALAVVVLYTKQPAFSSPLAIVVVAAIGLAALLLQTRLRKDRSMPVHAPVWLNMVGVCLAVAAVFADVLHLSAKLILVAPLGAIVCFAVSGIVVLRRLRKQK